MNEPPGSRMRVAETGLTMAEYFRDTEHRDVLLFIDNIFRFVQAGSEVSALLGRMRPQLDISLHCLQKWESFRSALLLQKQVLLHLFRLYMSRRMT